MATRSFVFGTYVDDYNFTGRRAETSRLLSNFEDGVNTVLISPRRWGKTSLVRKVCREVDRTKVLPVYLDAFACRDEWDFYNALASNVLCQTSSRAELWMEDARDFLSRLTPRVTFTSTSGSVAAVELGLSPKTHTPEEALSLAEEIAKRKGVRLMVCIDEFQQIGTMPGSLDIQKRLRTVWQTQQHASYCLFGSKRHLMSDIFQSRSMPLYQFGDTIFLQRIPASDWTPYITSHFADRGRRISDALAGRICEMVDGYSSYVQQLAWLVMASLETGGEATDDTLREALDELLEASELLFIQQTATLSAYQMNFLRAVAAGAEDLTSAATRESWRLGSYSNIARLKASLSDRDLIEAVGSHVSLTDPVFGLWLRRKWPGTAN